jgi:hypothetical protein
MACVESDNTEFKPEEQGQADRPVLPQVPTRFRRASQLRLGPLVLSDPVMLEMSISRIVGQFHEKVIGIVGEYAV